MCRYWLGFNVPPLITTFGIVAALLLPEHVVRLG